MTIVPAMEIIIPRVMKKNFLPDIAMHSLWTWWENLWASLNQPSDGIVRRIFNGFLDSSLIDDAMKNIADVRANK